MNGINELSKPKSIELSKIIIAIIISTLLNISGSKIAGFSAFPLYMDSIATIGCAALFGMIPAVIVAICSNFILSRFATTALPFMLCHICTAVFAGIIFKRSQHKNNKSLTVESFLWAGLASAFSNSLLGDTFSLLLFWGNTSIPQVDNAVQGIFLATESIPFACYWGGTVTNIIDKLISALFGFFIYWFYNKIFNNDGTNNVKIFENNEKHFRVESIILILAVINLFATFYFKNLAEKKTGECFSLLAKELNEDVKNKNIENINKVFFPYSYFNPEIKISLEEFEQNLLENKTNLLYTKVQNLVYTDYQRLLFGFDSLSASSFILIFVIVVLLLQKQILIKNEYEKIKIQSEEHKKISRNIHDSLLQNLAALKLQIQNDEKEKSLYFTNQTITDLRFLCGVLKIDSEKDFISQAKEKLEIFSAIYSIDSSFNSASRNALTFSSEKKTELNYIYQELLNNIAHHAEATKVSVKMIDFGNSFLMNVTDNGKGFDINNAEKSGHYGIQNIKERVALLGGTVEWENLEEGGTQVFVQV